MRPDIPLAVLGVLPLAAMTGAAAGSAARRRRGPGCAVLTVVLLTALAVARAEHGDWLTAGFSAPGAAAWAVAAGLAAWLRGRGKGMGGGETGRGERA
jgi:hypothetical protein